MTAAQWTLGILGVGAIAIAALGAREEEGFFSPVFSPSGDYIYFVKRSTAGMVWGFGIEHFTGPAKARVRRDDFELCRMRPDGTSFEVVRRFPQSPLVGKTIENYRGRIFGYPHIALRFDGGELEYELGVSIPRQPSSDSYVLRRRAHQGHPSAWQKGYTGMATGDEVLREPVELLTAKGKEAFPCAVVAYNDRAGSLQVLRQTSTCHGVYPNGIRWNDVSEQSRSVAIRRSRVLHELRDSYIRHYLAQGMNEGAAMLAADRRLADEGYYPRPPHLIARQVARSGEPLFRIAEGEFQAGLFPDIEEALRQPGKEVEKSSSPYLIHDHFVTSRALNQALASGTKSFYVERAGKLYELSITPSRPATR